MLKKHLDLFLTNLFNWLFRRSPAAILIKSGLGMIALGLAGGMKVFGKLPLEYGQGEIKVEFTGGTPEALAYLSVIAGTLVVLLGFAWHFCLTREDRKQQAKKRIFAIELRGMHQGGNTPLKEALPAALEGRREEIVIDVRQNVADNVIVEPNAAVNRISMIKHELVTRQQGLDRSDLSWVFGGIAPVPLMFLAGNLLNDESRIDIFDWDRDRQCWRALDKADDGDRFEISGIESIPEGAEEAILSIAVSYLIANKDIAGSIGDKPSVMMRLSELSTSNHWSEHKQQALAGQFRETVIAMKGRGVKTIHVFLAGPNSLVFRLGKTYDERNMPSMIVYQYEMSSDRPYPWGVLMPNHGRHEASAVFNSRRSA